MPSYLKLNLKKYLVSSSKSRLAGIIKLILPIFIIWLVLIIVVVAIDYKLSCHEVFCQKGQSVSNLAQDVARPWDGGWYMSIVEHGYNYSPALDKQFNVAFFPVAPLVYKFFRLISFNNSNLYLSLSILFNLILFLLTIALSLRIVELIINKKLSNTKLILVSMLALALPSNFFISTIYADSILIFCLSACLFFAIKGSLFRASIFAAIASATKSIGLAGFLIILTYFILKILESFKTKAPLVKLSVIIPYLLISLSGIIGYSLYLKAEFNEPLAFIKVQKTWGRNTDSNAVSSAKKIIKNNILGLSNPRRLPESNVDSGVENKLNERSVRLAKIIYAIFNTLNFIVVSLFTPLTLLLYLKKKGYQKQPDAALLLCSLTTTLWLIPALTGTLWSMNRYLILPSILITILIASLYLERYYTGSPKRLKIISAQFIALATVSEFAQLLFLWCFINWIFVGQTGIYRRPQT